MKYKIIDNFLNEESFLKIKNTITSNSFPFYYSKVTDKLNPNDGIYLTHLIFNNDFDKSVYFELIKPIIYKLKVKSLIRIKVNLYAQTTKIIEHSPHIDFKFKHNGFLYYLNTCDGFTRLGKNIKIKSVENRGLIFESNKLHNSSTSTNIDGRLNINFNYF
jgi:hypothetical protein